jgi:hypothetical protein
LYSHPNTYTLHQFDLQHTNTYTDTHTGSVYQHGMHADTNPDPGAMQHGELHAHAYSNTVHQLALQHPSTHANANAGRLRQHPVYAHAYANTWRM